MAHGDPWRDAPPDQILMMGVIPFIPGAVVKTALAAVIGRAIVPYHIQH